MLVLKAFHLIAMVAWFAGLFYLPRLFVYHTQTKDSLGLMRFATMERRLYYGIMWPAGLLTTVLGVWLLSANFTYYLHAYWMGAKLVLVVLLWVFHVSCGHFVSVFRANANTQSTLFFRIFNELPTVFLVSIILLVELKP